MSASILTPKRQLGEKGKGPERRLHPESLLNVPLLRQMLADPAFRLVPRRIDRHWTYHSFLSNSMIGFNPLEGAYFYGSKSFFADWLKDTKGSARKHNPNDALVDEALFGVHDYLHAWAYRAIHDIHPKLGLGTAPITHRNIEDFAFCHLLTEAAATVGLDYWYLATKRFDEVCDIGSSMSCLTISYREASIGEFRKHSADFTVQRPEFFADIARFYCSGRFPGFDVRDVRRSPRLLNWLRHELTYGEQQRVYIRMWLRYLADKPIAFSTDELKQPVSLDGRWKRDVLQGVSELLWQKVKEDKLHTFTSRIDRASTWKSNPAKRADYRFVNVNRDDGIEGKSRTPVSYDIDDFEYLFGQYVSRYDCDRVDEELKKLFPLIRKKKDPSVLRYLFRDQPLIDAQTKEPRDLFFPN